MREIRQSDCGVTSSGFVSASGCVFHPQVKQTFTCLLFFPDHPPSATQSIQLQHSERRPLHFIVMAEAVVLLSAVASCSQLAEQLIKACRRIYKAYRRIDDDPLSHRKDLEHLDQISGIARLIIQNPALQTDSVASVLRTCLSEVEELRRLLNECSASNKDRPMEKIRKALLAVVNGKKVEALFQRLEKQKMSLALCIHEVDSYVGQWPFLADADAAFEGECFFLSIVGFKVLRATFTRFGRFCRFCIANININHPHLRQKIECFREGKFSPQYHIQSFVPFHLL